jgi:hypothetical protein
VRIRASIGNAPRSESLDTNVYKLTLTADTLGERRFLAGLFKTVRCLSSWDMRLRNCVPFVGIRISTKAKAS